MKYKSGDRIAIIGHVGHGSTCLSHALTKVITLQDQVNIVVSNNEEKDRGITINESVPYLINNSYSKQLFIDNNTRNHRRKEKRSTKSIKTKYNGKSNPFSKYKGI